MNLAIRYLDRTAFAGGAGLATLFAIGTNYLLGDPFLGMVIVLCLVTLARWAKKIRRTFGYGEE